MKKTDMKIRFDQVRMRRRWPLRLWTALMVGVTGALLPAAEFPPVASDGTLTLDVPAGDPAVYETALPAATKLVKTGVGEAVLKVASTVFTGEVDVQGGTLTLKDVAAAGTGTKIAVTGDAATLHLNFPRPDGARQDTAFFTGHDVTIRGRGADGKGAFRYTALDSLVCDDSMLDSLSLSGDAFIAIPSRFGVRDAIGLNGYALTRIDGTGDWMMFNGACRVSAGVISNAVGNLIVQRTPTFADPSGTALCLSGGDLVFYGATPALPCRVTLCGGRLQTASAGDGRGNVVTGPVAVEKATDVLNVAGSAEQAAQQRLELAGAVTMSDRLTHKGPGTLGLNGPVSGGKDLYVSAGTAWASWAGAPGGRVVCSSNVVRTVDGLVLNGTDARLDLSDGTLDAGWFRLGNGWSRNTLVQSGGAFAVRGNTYVGESNGYGAFLATGGTASFAAAVNIAGGTVGEGLVWQEGGIVRVRGGAWDMGGIFLGQKGRGFLGVFGGATNDTRNARNGNDTRLRLGAAVGGQGTLAVSGAGSVVETEALVMGASGVVSTNVVAITDGGTLKANRFLRADGVGEGSVQDVYADGGVVLPTYWYGWNNANYENEKFYTRCPDFWTLGPRGLTIDTSELETGTEGQAPDVGVFWPHPLSDAAGQGIASVTLPESDAAFAKETYRGPVFVDIEGPVGSHGAAAVAAFDPTTRKLTQVVVVSPGNGYDERTRVYVRSAAKTGRYKCGCALTGARAGGRLLKRGDWPVTLFATNTYTGGTVVESGALVLVGERSFPTNTPLKVMDGATLDCKGRELAVSTLSGVGGAVTNCTGLSVGEALELSVAELFAASGPLTVDASVDFAEGAVVRVTGTESLPAYEEATRRPILRAAKLTGAVPSLSFVDAAGRPWKVRRSGKSLILAPVKGLVMVIR